MMRSDAPNMGQKEKDSSPKGPTKEAGVKVEPGHVWVGKTDWRGGGESGEEGREEGKERGKEAERKVEAGREEEGGAGRGERGVPGTCGCKCTATTSQHNNKYT